MNYYLWTIGCQMNFADSRRAADALETIGYRQVDRPQEADLIVLNTCVVRQSAEDKVMGRLTSLQGLKRRKPDLQIALMGCFVHEMPSLQERFPWVDAFALPSDVDTVLDLARDLAAGVPLPGPPTPGEAGPRAAPVSAGVAISYGCDHLCTYCVVRLRRGEEVSRPVAEILEEVRDLAARGAREVTLLGQNVDSYGHDLARADRRAGKGDWRPDLADLLEAVHEVQGLERIRFLTSHPADMTGRLIETVARLPKVCEHMELPVQSGDDSVLRRMGRGYSVAQYRDLVARIRRALDRPPRGPGTAAAQGVGLATDVIVGFPGETVQQFEATYRLLEELRFDMVHVAAYSPRPGTPAEHLPDDVSPEEKERRRQAVDALQERIVGEINAQFQGQTVEVLVEERHRGRWRGRTRTNKLVFFDIDAVDRTGQLAQVLINWTGPWSMQGELVDTPRSGGVSPPGRADQEGEG